jgi:hypothetical protein
VDQLDKSGGRCNRPTAVFLLRHALVAGLKPNQPAARELAADHGLLNAERLNSTQFIEFQPATYTLTILLAHQQ